jgi:flagellar operon protein
MPFRVINGKIIPVELPVAGKSNSVKGGTDFKDIFEKELDKAGQVKFSGHAAERLKDRNIELNAGDMEKLSEAIDKAGLKGAKESLLLYRDIAFIASIKNKTIITAVDGKNAKDNVFTNIDSAVIIS